VSFYYEIGKVDIGAGLSGLLVLPLGSLFGFQLLALAFGLLALTFDD
jgi:hypothetical protein